MQPPRVIQPVLLLAALALGTMLEAAGKEVWTEVRSPHFVAYTDAGEDEARNALKGFEGIRSVFDKVFPGIRVDPPKPVFLIVVENAASMQRFLPHLFEGKDPSRPGGYFISGPDRNYAILRLDVDHQADQPYFVLFHEYTHSIIHQNFPSLPTWLDEGSADFYGATEIRSGHVYLGRVPAGRLRKLQTGSRLPLATLLTVTHDSPHYQEGEKTGLFYAQSWALVHYLFMDEQARKAGLFQTYLKALQSASDPLAAARAGLGDLDQLESVLALYSRKRAFTFWDLPLTVKLTDQDFHSRGLEDPEARVVRAEFLQYTRHEMEARPLLEQALALAPQRPDVHAAIGYGHVLRGDSDQARLAFTEALRLGSLDFRPPYYLAKLAQESLGAGAVDSAQILLWLESARSLRPDFPGIHMALCRQYGRDPKDPDKAIREGAEAIRLEPQNLAYRANLGSVCMNLDLGNEARIIGDQLRQLAGTEVEKRMGEAYASELARYFERKQAMAAMPGSGARNRSGPSPSAAPLKFSLPSYLEPLGKEVLQLVLDGKTDEAIRKTEQALAQAKYPYDRKALQNLLESLRERTGSK